MQTPNVCSPSPEDGPSSPGRHRLDRTVLDLIVRAGRDPGLTPPNKAVLLAVIAFTVEDGVCTATDQVLARASRTSIPTVQRALKLFEGERIFRRTYRPHDAREIRLITGDQFRVVDVVELESTHKKKEEHQQHGESSEWTPVSSPIKSERPLPVKDDDPETERLVALLTARALTEDVARKLVREFPDRIVPQIEAHRHRNVRDLAGSLVVAIRKNWPIVVSQTQPTAPEFREQARRDVEAKRQAAFDAQVEFNARRRDEEEKVKAFWEALPEDQKGAFDDEAVEASPHRDEIRSMSPIDPLSRAQRAAARWKHVRRRLGLEFQD